MCGIIHGKRRDNMPVGRAIIKRYHKQRERGHEGFGFIAIDKGKLTGVYHFEKECEVEEALKNCKSSTILFHHRLPTSTPNLADANHPIAIVNDTLAHNYYLVHNGVMQNEDTLKAEHEKLGFAYTTFVRTTETVETLNTRTDVITEKFNDSEALAIEVALFLDGKKDHIDAVGSIAFVCIETEKDGTVLRTHYGRNLGNPLVLEDNNDLFFVKSMGEGSKVEEDEIVSIEYGTNEVSMRKIPVGRRWVETKYEPKKTGYHPTWDEEGIPSPYVSRLPEGKKENQGKGLFPDDLNYEQEEMYDNIQNAIDDSYENYKLSDEHLLDLWSEMESLQKDIADCKRALASGLTNSEDIVYNEEYLSECKASLKRVEDETTKLEHYLNIKRDNKAIIISCNEDYD